MASGLLVLLDDIASILDDVSILTKVAVEKTAGVLGDDLALNAQQVAGIDANRELSVVWAVAVGSLGNKAILVPSALLFSWLAPWAITPLMIVGGTYLCYEGCEKLAHKFLHHPDEDKKHDEELMAAVIDPSVDLVVLERDKIRGAIRTDFVLSAEIIVITLGIVKDSTFMTRMAVLVSIGIIMTVGVYGLVAAIVKLDDLGWYLARPVNGKPASGAKARVGKSILALAPYLLKGLTIVGTAAMFLVGGGIIVEGVEPLHHALEGIVHHAGEISVVGPIASTLSKLVLDAAAGLLAGAIALILMTGIERMWKRKA